MDRSYYDRNVFKNKDGAFRTRFNECENIREFSKLTNEEISQIGDTIKIKPNDNSQKVRIKLMLKLVMLKSDIFNYK